VAIGDTAAVRGTIADSISLMMMLNVPALVGLVVLATPIVRVMYERGQFVALDTTATAIALQYYALGLVGYSIVRIASPVFYALGSARTPVKVSVATVAVNATMNILLVRAIGYPGLALGTSIAAMFNAGMLLYLLRRRLGGIEGDRIARSLLRIGVAAVAMGVAAAGADLGLARALPGDGFALVAIRLGLAIGAALAVLAAAAHLLGIPEYERARGMVVRRFRRAPR
jgi:putative peptidoglycan lipid II flippase